MAEAKALPAGGNVGRALGREVPTGDPDLEAEAEAAVRGAGVGGQGARALERERRPPGTQRSQEAAVPAANAGSSPPTNVLIPNGVASVLAPSPEEERATGRCEDRRRPCCAAARRPACPGVQSPHCADERPQVGGRAESHPAAHRWGLLSGGQHGPHTGTGRTCVLVPAESLSTWMCQGKKMCHFFGPPCL